MATLVEATRTYKDGSRTVRALDKVSVAIGAGEFIAVVGPSGCGKTTLLNVLSGIDRLDAGDVIVLGRQYSECSAAEVARSRLANIGIVHQNINLLPDLTLAENVALVLEATGVPRRRARSQAVLALRRTGVEDLGDRFPGEVSGGERQRAAISRAIVGNRRLLLADEPTGALDSENTMAVIELLKSVAESGIAVVVATHNPLVARAADRIVALRDGKVRSNGPGPLAPDAELNVTAL